MILYKIILHFINKSLKHTLIFNDRVLLLLLRLVVTSNDKIYTPFKVISGKKDTINCPYIENSVCV